MLDAIISTNGSKVLHPVSDVINEVSVPMPFTEGDVYQEVSLVSLNGPGAATDGARGRMCRRRVPGRYEKSNHEPVDGSNAQELQQSIELPDIFLFWIFQ